MWAVLFFTKFNRQCVPNLSVKVAKVAPKKVWCSSISIVPPPGTIGEKFRCKDVATFKTKCVTFATNLRGICDNPS